MSRKSFASCIATSKRRTRVTLGVGVASRRPSDIGNAIVDSVAHGGLARSPRRVSLLAAERR
jgi:hypothetical protein